jgi:hypothetical protein
VTAGLRINWTVEPHGWALCVIEDRQTRGELVASYIADAPEDFLTAVARLVAGEVETRAQFAAEPAAYRWILCREGDEVGIRVLYVRDGRDRDDSGSVVWSGRTDVHRLARAVIRCFDEVARTYGESGYHERWGRSFPGTELEALRRISGGPADPPNIRSPTRGQTRTTGSTAWVAAAGHRPSGIGLSGGPLEMSAASGPARSRGENRSVPS